MIEDLYDVAAGEVVTVRASDGTFVEGVPSRIDRDEAGIRIEICPYARDAPQYRLRASRTPTGWRPPSVGRRTMRGEWERCGRLVDLEQ